MEGFLFNSFRAPCSLHKSILAQVCRGLTIAKGTCALLETKKIKKIKHNT